MDAQNRTTPKRYNTVAQLLHWTMAVLLVYLIFFSQYEEVPDLLMEQKIQLHSGLGVIVLILGLFRFYWRRNRPRPAPIETDAPWQKKASEFVHYAFYAIFLIGPVIGFILAGLVSYPVRIFGWLEISSLLQDNTAAASFVNSLHGLTADILTALVVVHIAAAIYHQFIKKNGLIWRMLPFGR